MLKRADIPEDMDKSSPIYDLFSNFNSFLDNCANAYEINNDLLMQIIKDNSQTEFGKEHDFENIKTVEEFREKIPLTTYDDYFESIERMLQGEKNILTSLPVVFTPYLLGVLEFLNTFRLFLI